MKVYIVLVLTSTLCSLQVHAGYLGKGEGLGSCAAAPFRAHEVQWTYGCPAFAPCCSEYGFCRPLEEWEYGKFRCGFSSYFNLVLINYIFLFDNKYKCILIF